MSGGLYCKLLKKEIPYNYCIACKDKTFKLNDPKKRTKALGITKATKMKVWERDNHRCIFCGKLVNWNYANSHFIKRSQGGLGIEQNIMTNCDKCHFQLDNTTKRKDMIDYAFLYLSSKYKDFNIEKLYYKKR